MKKKVLLTLGLAVSVLSVSAQGFPPPGGSQPPGAPGQHQSSLPPPGNGRPQSGSKGNSFGFSLIFGKNIHVDHRNHPAPPPPPPPPGKGKPGTPPPPPPPRW